MAEKLSELLEQTRAARFLQWKRYALVFVGNEVDADEVIQEACKRTLMAAPALETEDEMHRYMKPVIRTSAFKLLQDRNRLNSGEDVGVSQADETPSALDRMIQLLDTAEIAQLTARALDLIEALPKPERTIVSDLLLRDPKLTFREVSEREGVPLGALHRRFKAIVSGIGGTILAEAPDPGAVLRLIREDHGE